MFKCEILHFSLGNPLIILAILRTELDSIKLLIYVRFMLPDKIMNNNNDCIIVFALCIQLTHGIQVPIKLLILRRDRDFHGDTLQYKFVSSQLPTTQFQIPYQKTVEPRPINILLFAISPQSSLLF